jgi:hypothetical protein
MRHAPLDIFTPSCLDMHGEYILTPLTVKIDEPQERIIYPSPSSDFNTLRIHSTYEGT